MTKKETYELVIKQLLANIKEIDFADYEGDAIEEAPTISVCNSYGELGGVTIYMVSIDHNSGDVMVEFEGDDGEMTTKHMCDVVTDPNDYEKIANAIHDCLFPYEVKILSAVDTEDNTKFPICICRIDHNGNIEKRCKVAYTIANTLYNVQTYQAENALNVILSSSDNFARIDGYELFLESCPVIIDK